jgi:hypothetical protein
VSAVRGGKNEKEGVSLGLSISGRRCVKNPCGEKLPADDMIEIEVYIATWAPKEEAPRT